jgi:hypothetical protein
LDCSWHLYVFPLLLSIITPNTLQMQYDTPLSTNPTAANITTLPLRQQLKQGFKDMGSRSFSSAKNFGKVGAIFSFLRAVLRGVSLLLLRDHRLLRWGVRALRHLVWRSILICGGRVRLIEGGKRRLYDRDMDIYLGGICLEFGL